ncbi:ATP synthase F0 subcomplex B subunit [Anaerobranca californiensis DSM 14826]|uniref:ATP synthase subunit b n=1 Tax=Anaerobranca californiensis DSM 14826 TaxID=1120989 RepID=A0A1M6MAX0_9FIRM|nr:F0F1 ATP synthase subunit B [Anaerobranca californiensis]SHJ80618.1 ATP synthase F0 subcomplex B subunit [Anaerobranca californiensis DSM 14826]
MLEILFSTIIFTLVSVVGLFLILRWLLFRPVTEVLDKRADKIKSDIETARKNREEAERIKAELEDRLEKAKDEAKEIIEKAVSKGNEVKEEIIKEAKKEAERILERARKEIELEKARAVTQLKDELAILSTMIASKVIEENLTKERNEHLISKVIEGMGETYEKYHR